MRVWPQMRIEEVRWKLSDGLPKLHELKLFLGEVEIQSGTCAEAGLSVGSEVTAVSNASAQLAINYVKDWSTEVSSWRQFIPKQAECAAEPLMPALTFLAQFDDLDVQQSHTLFDVLFEALASRRRMASHHNRRERGHLGLDDEICAVAKCFGHTCDPQIFVPKLIDCFQDAPPVEQRYESSEVVCLIWVLVIALREVFLFRGRQVIPREPLDALVQSAYACGFFLGGLPDDFPFIMSDRMQFLWDRSNDAPTLDNPFANPFAFATPED